MLNKKNKLNTNSIAVAAGIWSVLFMLVMWLLANMGLYVSAAEQMSKLHMFFNLTLVGLISGMIEAGVVSFLLVYSFAFVYNIVVKK